MFIANLISRQFVCNFIEARAARRCIAAAGGVRVARSVQRSHCVPSSEPAPAQLSAASSASLPLLFAPTSADFWRPRVGCLGEIALLAQQATQPHACNLLRGNTTSHKHSSNASCSSQLALSTQHWDDDSRSLDAHATGDAASTWDTHLTHSPRCCLGCITATATQPPSPEHLLALAKRSQLFCAFPNHSTSRNPTGSRFPLTQLQQPWPTPTSSSGAATGQMRTQPALVACVSCVS